MLNWFFNIIKIAYIKLEPWILSPQDKKPIINYSVVYDLTKTITPDTPVFPGDPCFKVEKVQSIDKGSSYNLCALHMGNHMGTHIDFPAHVIRQGKTSSDYALDTLMGEGIIVDVPESKELGISRKFIENLQIKENDIVFFKTTNSKLDAKTISERFVHLTLEGANELINKKVKIVGIDYISIDALEDEKLPVHNKLLKNNILIVENLELNGIVAGRYTDICVIPANIPHMDGLPVRAFIRK